MITIRKIKKFLVRKWWRFVFSAHVDTKIKNELFLLFHHREVLVVDGWMVKFYNKKSRISNWGDDINVYFLELISGKHVIPAQTLFFPRIRKKYCCIGTILPQCLGRRSVVWGSGYGLVGKAVKERSVEVKAVRGPLTRNYLRENHVDCPEVYGDPALLLPDYYQPKNLVKKKVGLIPHHQDWDQEICKIIDLPSDWIMINLVKYDNWTDIIDQICSCDLILSASLHGLIVSDAYRIPNIFVEFIVHQPNYIKYNDYFLSVNRTPCEPHQFKNNMNINELELEARESMSQVKINTVELKKACPFRID